MITAVFGVPTDPAALYAFAWLSCSMYGISPIMMLPYWPEPGVTSTFTGGRLSWFADA